MKKHFIPMAALCVVGAGLVFAGSPTATAQEQQQASATTPPPNVLIIDREFLKPGKAGSLHEKSESAFVQAFSQAQWPEHSLAMESLSGKSRALFFRGYDSFADAEKDLQATQKNPTLSTALDSAQQADGELLSSYDTATFVYQPDKGVSAPVDIPHMRYMEITAITVRPGHNADWEALVKLHNSVYGKMPNAHWAVYEEWYGAGTGDLYLVIAPFKSLAEIDQQRTDRKQIMSSVSADQKKQMADLVASTIESIETNLFMFNPKMSYVPDGWKSADPEFWGQK